MIAAAAVVGGLVWLGAAEPLSAADGSAGLSLLDARVGVLAGGLVLLALGLPALVMGLGVSATGHPLSGVFSVSVGLLFLAGAGGSAEGYLRRHALPAGYGWLLVEALLWAGLVLGLLAAVHRLRPGLRRRLARLATPKQKHWGDEIRLGPPDGRAMLAGVVAAAAGGVGCVVLVQSEATGQVIGSLVLSFTLAGLLAQMLVGPANPVGVLLSPLAVAVGAYGYVLVGAGYGSEDALLAAWYARELPGPALVLPIFYASAGVAGAAMGIGLGQAVHAAREHAMVAA